MVTTVTKGKNKISIKSRAFFPKHPCEFVKLMVLVQPDMFEGTQGTSTRIAHLTLIFIEATRYLSSLLILPDPLTPLHPRSY